MTRPLHAEQRRLEESRQRTAHWKRWGPYLSERAWGTVREDYSEGGAAWDYFPHDHARSKAYRWGEDGLGGICDRHQFVCFAIALWNGRDPILKERLFGLTGPEGNHGEDVKECYYYLDSTPTHSYLKFLYKYPQREFPYARLVEENRARGSHKSELELIDTGVFDDDAYFDVLVEYAKASPEDIAIRLTVTNRGKEAATLDLLPTVWFRNTWSPELSPERPAMRARNVGLPAIEIDHHAYGHRWLLAEGSPERLFTENETSMERLYGVANRTPYVKDAFHHHVISGNSAAVNPHHTGTKAAFRYHLEIGAGESRTVRLRLCDREPGDPAAAQARVTGEHAQVFAERIAEADEFYAELADDATDSAAASEDARRVQRQAFAGLLWSKQFYHYDMRRWLSGDPAYPAPPEQRKHGRNRDWSHLYNADVISMPDKWEYPWYAAWDLAFHCVPLALVDPDFAKEQLILLLREWYMHPNGQIPAYEWAFGDVNPPVHAWAAWRVYKIEKKHRGTADRGFLERVFQKLLLNFTWWVNRKDAEGNNVFQGGFLGLDNIGVFDRSAPLPTGGHIEQSDGTSWMGMYCLNMLTIALELARENPAYEDVASKFFEHFVYICRAMNDIAGAGIELWDPVDGFYYDVLHLPDGSHFPLKVRSMVGLVPLFAVEPLDPDLLDALPGFRRRMQWFLDNRPELGGHVETRHDEDGRPRRLLSLVNRERLTTIARYLLDENEFLSPYGIRSVSRCHRERPYILALDGMEYRVDYEPAESSTGQFGGNSNWRGPIWFPMNYLLIESLQKFNYFHGASLRVELPTGSGEKRTLDEVAAELSRRLTRIFLRDRNGRRAVHGGVEKLQSDPHFRDLILFYEYFHGENGAGIGASHQTGWTALVAKLIHQSGV